MQTFLPIFAILVAGPSGRLVGQVAACGTEVPQCLAATNELQIGDVSSIQSLNFRFVCQTEKQETSDTKIARRADHGGDAANDQHA